VKFYNPTPGYGPAKIADTFIPNGHPTRPGGHTGWDNRAPRRTPIRPIGPAKAYQIVSDGACGYGIRLYHGEGWTSSYCHFDQPTTLKVGDLVDYDTILGYVGMTGNAVYYHLHFSIEKNGVRQDPDLLLEGQQGTWIRPGWEPEIGDNVEIIAGKNRYETAALVSKREHPNGAHTVWVASGEDYPDALTAGRPLLLTRKDSLPAETLNEIKRLGATKAVVLGGEAAIASKVKAEISQALA
jgi:hypothetical protein